MNPTSRLGLAKFLNELGLTGHAVEIGVMCGTFSREFLDEWKGQRLYMIDTWRQLKNYHDMADVDDAVHLSGMVRAYEQTAKHAERRVMWQMESLQASEHFQDGSLDFVYIDANHTFEAVMMDIAMWFPKVKRGGIIAGHDYHDDENQPWGRCGVKKAVLECFSPSNVINVISEKDPSWWVKK